MAIKRDYAHARNAALLDFHRSDASLNNSLFLPPLPPLSLHVNVKGEDVEELQISAAPPRKVAKVPRVSIRRREFLANVRDFSPVSRSRQEHVARRETLGNVLFGFRGVKCTWWILNSTPENFVVSQTKSET